jgi:hypothetical protein
MRTSNGSAIVLFWSTSGGLWVFGKVGSRVGETSKLDAFGFISVGVTSCIIGRGRVPDPWYPNLKFKAVDAAVDVAAGPRGCVLLLRSSRDLLVLARSGSCRVLPPSRDDVQRAGSNLADSSRR